MTDSGMAVSVHKHFTKYSVVTCLRMDAILNDQYTINTLLNLNSERILEISKQLVN